MSSACFCAAIDPLEKLSADTREIRKLPSLFSEKIRPARRKQNDIVRRLVAVQGEADAEIRIRLPGDFLHERAFAS